MPSGDRRFEPPCQTIDPIAHLSEENRELETLRTEKRDCCRKYEPWVTHEHQTMHCTGKLVDCPSKTSPSMTGTRSSCNVSWNVNTVLRQSKSKTACVFSVVPLALQLNSWAVSPSRSFWQEQSFALNINLVRVHSRPSRP